MKQYKFQKDIFSGRTGFNADWVRGHSTEAAFVTKCASLNLLDADKAKELYSQASIELNPEPPRTKK